MRRDLFWTNGSKQVLHIVHAGHIDWGTFGVIRMNVSDLHVGESCLVVVRLTILSLVLWHDSFSSHFALGFHLLCVGDFEFGLDVISDGEASHLGGLCHWEHLIQKCLGDVHF